MQVSPDAYEAVAPPAGVAGNAGRVDALLPDENFTLENLDREEANYLIAKKILGEGTTSIVKLAWSKRLNKKCAVKIVTKYKLNEASHRNLKRELQIHRSLSEANSSTICNLLEVTETNQHYFIWLEFVEGGDLISYIEREGGRLAEPCCKSIIKRALQSLQFIHNSNVVHRDIKAENILLDFDDNKQVVGLKLADFGLSEILEQGKFLNTPCGSPCYVAPEIVDKRPYKGEPVDVWALGILMYAILVGEFPFSLTSMASLFDKIRTSPIHFPAWLSTDSVDLLKKMLNRDVHQRVTVHEALEHSWFSSLRTSLADEFVKLPLNWTSP